MAGSTVAVAVSEYKEVVRISVDADHAVIEIADTGPDIPEDIRSCIFDAFFTTKEMGRGTGQGLAIARSVIVEKHAGRLAFDTRLGAGTSFYIRLPIAGRAAVVLPDDAGASAA